MNVKKTAWLLIFMLLSFTQVFSQTSKVWVTIPDAVHVPYLGTDGKLVSIDSLFNLYISLLDIFSCERALPSSRKPALKKVYELSCHCDAADLIYSLSNNVNVLTGVYPAPVYDTLHTPNDYNLSLGVNNYALNLINAPSAWDITTGDSNVILGISDQGYDPMHSELAGKFVYLNSGSPLTTHGNAVAITAAGKTNNNNGLSSIGYHCKLALYANTFNEILNAAYAGMRVINISWSSSCFFNPYQQQCIDEAYQAGAFLVAAAGNGNTCGVPSAYVYPAAYDHVFAVTSIGSADNHEQVPNDSTSTHQHNDRVDLAAPGYDVAINPMEGWYINTSGTSFATPYVSGTIGLMLSVNPCLSRKDIDTILRLSAVNIDSLNPQYAGKLGAGRLDAYAAVQLAGTWTPHPMVMLSQPVSAMIPVGGSTQFTAACSSTLPLYQWQRDSSGIYVNVIDNAIYSGSQTATLTLQNVPAILNNQLYRCVMTSGYCQIISDTASLVLNDALIPEDAGSIQVDTLVCFGDTLSVSINPVNNATGYVWSLTGNANFISGQNTNSIQIQIFDTASTISVTPYNANGMGASASVSVATISLPTGFLSGNISVCAGDSAVLTLNATGQGPWFGIVNDSISFSGTGTPIQIVVHPNVTTYYILQDLYTLDGCHAYPDFLGSSASVTLLPFVKDTVSMTVCSGQLPYLWNGNALSATGIYSDTILNSSGCDTLRTLQLTVIGGNVPLAPATLSQVLVSNTCFNRTYRYTAAVTANASGYSWTLPLSVGGVAGVTVDSGDINSSRIIKLSYYSNAAAYATDSIRVRAYNSCGQGPFRSAKLIHAALNTPAAPSSITVTPLITNICGERRYRYTAPALPSGSSIVSAATGYLWSFTLPVPLQAQLDSGTWTSKSIIIKYPANAASLTSDSIFLQYASACGYGNKRALRINLPALNPPSAPTSITITPISTDICGNKIFRYVMPVLPAGSSTLAPATGYQWLFSGMLASSATIDSGSLTGRSVRMKFSNNNAATIGDSVGAYYLSSCGNSNKRMAKLINKLLTPPAAPSSIIITLIKDSCGARIYRYTAPVLPIATTTAMPATGYEWSMPTGSAIALSASLDSGILTGSLARSIRLKFTNNAAALYTDSIRVRYSSNCGNSNIKSQKLSNLAISTLASPSTLSGLISICPLVGTTTTARYTCTGVTSAVSYAWTLPTGAVLDSGGTGLKIKVRFLTASAQDSIFVQAVGANGCAGTKRVLKLITTGCSGPVVQKQLNLAVGQNGKNSFSASIYPNPSADHFRLQVKTGGAGGSLQVRIYDMNGRLMLSRTLPSTDSIEFGREWKPGVYTVSISAGGDFKLMKVLKY